MFVLLFVVFVCLLVCFLCACLVVARMLGRGHSTAEIVRGVASSSSDVAAASSEDFADATGMEVRRSSIRSQVQSMSVTAPKTYFKRCGWGQMLT